MNWYGELAMLFVAVSVAGGILYMLVAGNDSDFWGDE